MKILVEQKELLNSLQKTLGPTILKQNFPALNCVLINTQNNNLKLTSTDLDITITTKSFCEVKETGTLLIPMKRFISIVKELPNTKITLESSNNNLLISCKNIEYKINGLDPKEFPSLEKEKKAVLIKISPQELDEAIKLTSFSVSFEETKYVLNGILFELIKDEIQLVSSDGKRLSFVSKKLPTEQSEIANKISFILPIKAINEIQKLLKEHDDELFISVDNNKISFDFKHTKLISRTIEGEFPDYNQYIPKASAHVAKINRREFISVLRRIEILSTLEYQGVKLEIKKDSMIISKFTPQLGEAKEILPIEYSGEKIDIGFNPSFLLDVLKVLEDEFVHIEFLGTEKPAVIRSNSYIHLVLPMRI